MNIIIPNITEACLLTGYEYKQNNHTDEYINGLIEALNKEETERKKDRR